MASQGDGSHPPKWTRRQVRDLLAAVALLAGAVGAVTTAFLWDALAGWAVVSVVLIAVGVAAGVE